MANILIVEDEKNMQEIIAAYMQRGGHTCFTADDGVDALMVLNNNPMVGATVACAVAVYEGLK